MLNNADLFSKKTFKVFGRSVSAAFAVPLRDLPRVLFHGVILAAIIAGFWLLDSLKDPILARTVGIEYQPYAKFASVFTTLLVTCVYDFTTSLVSKATLFHLVSFTFGIATMITAALLGDPETGLNSGDKGPHRIIGWFSYLVIEAYGSLMVALFWSFTNSIMNLEQAKGTYGLIISIAQIGSIAGSTVATHSKTVGIARLYLMGSMLILIVSLLVKAYHIVFKDKSTEAMKGRVRSTSDAEISAALAGPPSFFRSLRKLFRGFYEGLLLIVQHRYTMVLLGVSCLYEVVVTVLDYEFKIMGADSVTIESIVIGEESHADSDKFASLLGHFGQLTNFVSFVVSFFGFSLLVHRIGVRYSLLVFPFVLFAAVVLTNLAPTLWVLFVSVSVVKALIFSLNEPVKELLYIPTSEPIKFKAKAWIDVFGSRFAKAAGSFITSLAAGNAAKLRAISEIPCIIIAIILILLVWSIGKEFDRLIETHETVGCDNKVYNGTYDIDSLPVRNGLRPGDVGYDGYDLKLFEGVFEDDFLSSRSTDTLATGGVGYASGAVTVTAAGAAGGGSGASLLPQSSTSIADSNSSVNNSDRQSRSEKSSSKVITV
jgi:AAA family ATP:ADP antiporter